MLVLRWKAGYWWETSSRCRKGYNGEHRTETCSLWQSLVQQAFPVHRTGRESAAMQYCCHTCPTSALLGWPALSLNALLLPIKQGPKINSCLDLISARYHITAPNTSAVFIRRQKRMGAAGGQSPTSSKISHTVVGPQYSKAVGTSCSWYSGNCCFLGRLLSPQVSYDCFTSKTWRWMFSGATEETADLATELSRTGICPSPRSPANSSRGRITRTESLHTHVPQM